MSRAVAPDAVRRLFWACGIYAAAAAFLSVVALSVYFEVSVAFDAPEGGLVESVQAATLLLASSAWFALARRGLRRNDGSPALAFAAAGFVSFAMFIRELDRFFDVALYHGAWSAVDGVVALCACAFFWCHRRRALGDWADFAESAQGWAFFSAVFAAVAFSQLFGWKGIWRAVFDNDIWQDVKYKVLVYDQDLERHVKNVVEESFELVSYSMMLAAAVIPHFLQKRKD